MSAYLQILLTIFAIISVLGGGYLAIRSGSPKAWREAAEGYKEQVTELKSRLQMSDERVLTMQKQIAELEARPDQTMVMNELRTMRQLLEGLAK